MAYSDKVKSNLKSLLYKISTPEERSAMDKKDVRDNLAGELENLKTGLQQLKDKKIELPDQSKVVAEISGMVDALSKKLDQVKSAVFSDTENNVDGLKKLGESIRKTLADNKPQDITPLLKSVDRSIELLQQSMSILPQKLGTFPQYFGLTDSTFTPINPATETTLALIKNTDGIKKVTDALPSGSNIIGRVGIDQTTPGTTNRVDTIAPAVLDTGNSTTTPLGGSATFTGTGFDMTNYATWSVTIFSNVASAASGLHVDWSEDNTNWDFSDTQTYAASVGNMITFGRKAKYVRLRYVNGASAQATFRVQAAAQPYAVRQTRKFVGNALLDQDTGQIVIAALQGHTTAGGGSWVDVKVNPSGSLAVDGSGVTQPVSPQPPTGTLADSSVTLTSANTAYAVPTSPPASPYLLVVSSNIANTTEMRWRLTTGTTLGNPIQPGASMSIRLPASTGLFLYSTAAGQIANHSTAIL